MNKRLLAAAFAVALPSLAAAQEVTLPPIVVTASRTAQTVDEALAPVTVITREDIERRPSQNVLELLRGTPGLTIINQGGAGKLSNVFLRGTKSDHVLVLIDGIKAGSATAGSFAWQDISPDQIERIEIVRGPRSSLYGSEAIGGVIQIFTRKGGGKLRPSANVGYGSYDTYKATANLSGGGARSWFNIGVSHLETNGFNACNNPDPMGCGVVEPDDDGYRRTAFSARGGLRFSRGEAELHFLQSQGRNEYDGAYDPNPDWAAPNESDVVQRVAGGRLTIAPVEGWQSSLSLGRSWDESDNFHDGRFLSTIDTIRDSISWLNDVAIGDHHGVSLGVDFQHDEVESTTAYDRTSRDNTGIFARYFGEFGKADVELAARLDHNQQYGDHTTGSAAWGYDLSTSLRLLASYGTAFKAPTFNDLYYPGFSNPNLEPERSRTFDIGIQGRLRSSRWSVHAFQTDIDDLIVSAPAPLWRQNIDEARILGLEASASTRMVGWTIAGSLTLLDTENRSADVANDGNELPRRPLRSARLDADRDFGTYSLGGTFFAASRSYDDAANTRELSGYGLLDLRAGVVLGKDWRLQAEVNNVFDKDYETTSFFNQPGRTFFVTLRYAPAP